MYTSMYWKLCIHIHVYIYAVITHVSIKAQVTVEVQIKVDVWHRREGTTNSRGERMSKMKGQVWVWGQVKLLL